MSTEMTHETKPIGIGGTILPRRRHACAFFNSREEEYALLLPFIKEGFERGEKGFHIVDPQLKDDHCARLRASGLNVAKLEKDGCLETRVWEHAYLRDGHFCQRRMCALIQEVLDEGRKRYPLTRLVAHMEWALEDRPGVDDLVEYETKLNDILGNYDDPVICTYDLAKFSGQVVTDIMRTHPVVIIGGIAQENPFYTPPDEFLAELRQRRKHA